MRSPALPKGNAFSQFIFDYAEMLPSPCLFQVHIDIYILKTKNQQNSNTPFTLIELVISYLETSN